MNRKDRKSPQKAVWEKVRNTSVISLKHSKREKVTLTEKGVSQKAAKI